MKRSRQVALATAVLATTLTGCASLTSPAITETPYEAADGSNAQIEDSAVKLRNFLVVADEKGQPGQVVGALVNDGANPVRVSLTADLGSTAQPTETRVQIPAHGLVQIGPSGTEMTLEQTPVAPGARMNMTAFSPGNGTAEFSVAVVSTDDPVYAGYTPAPAPTTPAPEPSASPSASSSASPTAGSNPSDQDGGTGQGDTSEPVTR